MKHVTAKGLMTKFDTPELMTNIDTRVSIKNLDGFGNACVVP
jgi:hypothetical protein